MSIKGVFTPFKFQIIHILLKLHGENQCARCLKKRQGNFPCRWISIRLSPGSLNDSPPQISVIAPALPELLWLPTVWRCPYIEIAFSTLDCSIVPTRGAWGSVTAAKRGPLKQSWAGIQHSRDGEPLGVLMQMRNVRVNGFFFFSSLGVLPGRCVSRHSFVV